jgi:hypothetical protein
MLAGTPLSWSHDGNSFLVAGQDKGRSGIFRVDRDSGRTSLLVEVQRPFLAIESPDGGNLYYSHGHPESPEVAFVKRVLASAEETILLKGKYGPRARLSADGRYLAVHENPRPRVTQAVLLVPTDGGAPRELSRVKDPYRTAFIGWTPDRQSVLINRFTEDGNSERWRIPLDGGEREQLGAKAPLPAVFKLHPDGRQVAFEVPVPPKPPEVWVLENFLPGPAANR